MKKVLVTGAAGFIGFHLVERLLSDGYQVVGLDNMNDYYDTKYKYARLSCLGIAEDQVAFEKLSGSSIWDNFQLIQMNLEDRKEMEKLFAEQKFEIVVNLAAQAGVRHSLTQPHEFMSSNIVGFLNVLEGCRHNNIEHLLYASSSSVYGLNETMPLSTSDNVDHPISLYAASKKANELMAHSYSHLYQLPTTGLRFFTVYGPWGRPDMALFIFTKNILEGKPIQVFNSGNMIRDFTYVADIVEGIARLLPKPPTGNTDWSGLHPDPSSSPAPWSVHNIGNSDEVPLMDFVREIESTLGKQAEIIYRPMQPGDVPKTKADVSALQKAINYRPETKVSEGIRHFIDWYLEFHQSE